MTTFVLVMVTVTRFLLAGARLASKYASIEVLGADEISRSRT